METINITFMVLTVAGLVLNFSCLIVLVESQGNLAGIFFFLAALVIGYLLRQSW